MSEDFRDDGVLMEAYASMSPVANSATGLGTARDKSQYLEANLAIRELTKDEVEALYRSDRIIEKVVSLLPADSAKKWGEWKVTGASDSTSAELATYCDRLKTRAGFTEASTLARLYGNGYLVMGINDGRRFDEPVDEANIQSVRFLKPQGRWQLMPDMTYGTPDEPEFYCLNFTTDRPLPKDEQVEDAQPRKIHHTRILRFWGKWLPAEILRQTGGNHDSVVQAMFNAFSQYMQGMGASSAMLTDFNVFKYKLRGLAKLLDDAAKQGEGAKSKAMNYLLTRFVAIQMGMSVTKGLMMDAENEEGDFISRNFAGVKDILRELQDLLVATADMPRSKLLGSPNTGAFSEAGLSDRYEWASMVESYQMDAWQDNLLTLGRLILLAKDGPTRGKLPESFGFEWVNTLQLTLQEESALKKLNAETDAVYIGAQILTPQEVRQSRFGGSRYGHTIILDENTRIIPAPRTDSVDLAQLRADAAQGLIPKEMYWRAAGYDPQQVEQGLREEFVRETRPRLVSPVDDDAYN